MTEEVDKFLRGLDQTEKVREFADSLGCTEMQAKVFVRACEQHFQWNGVRLLFKHGDGTTTTAVDDPQCLAFLRSEYGFLLPPEKPADTRQREAVVEIDDETVALALAGNWTAKGKIARAFSDDAQAAELFLKAKAGGRSVSETDRAPADNAADLKASGGSNPWREWNVTRQSQIFRADPALAARLAKAAGSAIGATKGMRTALAPALRRA